MADTFVKMPPKRKGSKSQMSNQGGALRGKDRAAYVKKVAARRKANPIKGKAKKNRQGLSTFGEGTTWTP